jgi:methyl-accepting chemotaxis protein
MHLLDNLRLRSRMALGFGSVLALLAVVVAMAALRFDAMDRAMDALVNQAWAKAQAVQDLDAATRANGARTLELVLTTDTARMADLRSRIDRNSTLAAAAIDKLQRLVQLPEGRRLLADIVELRGRYVASFRQVDTEVTAGRRDAAAQRSRDEMMPLLDQLQERTRALSQLQDRLAQEAGDTMHHAVQADRVAVLALGAGALALGLAFAWALTRSVTRPIQQALGYARRIAAGDLTEQLKHERRDEVGDLLRAMADMNHSLATVVGAVRERADSVACASSQIARGNIDLSQRTEEQASALQQTAASMEQLGRQNRRRPDRPGREPDGPGDAGPHTRRQLVQRCG